ncbi:MAG: bifunctional glutamate N-acetyltransferase/amino-acid acetyltransferase ArgJ [Mogibacterium sp.]|nr:bifunctional glutamate N-acetyltransferase/amino-acid acetyltransferase ArgJ [Mogibacterium sp.]
MVKVIEGGVTAAKGFRAGGIYSGIRKNPGKSDLALIVSDVPGNAAAVYTKNKVQAAHIAVTKRHIANGIAQAVLCNSGNANTCTPDGEEVAEQATVIAATQLGIKSEDVLPAATGVIGVSLPIEPFEAAMPDLVASLSYDGSANAALAILTTDTYIKEYAVQFEAGGKTCTLGGIAKGSGMIHINMGTMLSFISTDCAISQELVSKALHEVIIDTYNQVSVDGDSSTNDTVVVIANGLAGNEEITEEGSDYGAFCEALNKVAEELSKMIAGDGEGCTKLLEAHVTGAPTKETARLISKSVICSSLFKAAVFASDANWGRILCAIGYTDAEFDASNIDVSVKSVTGEVQVCKGSASIPFDDDFATKILSQKSVTVEIDLHDGSEEAYAWGCDLTYDYVKINGSYRS